MVRNKIIDYVKGMAIILVVLAHSFPGNRMVNFISLFHMAVFFIISGFCWSSRKINSWDDLKKYFIRKIKTLYIPFVLFNGICLLLNNLFIKINFYTINPNILLWKNSNIVVARFIGLSSVLSFGEITKGMIKILLFTGSTQFGGATWFLRTLFIVSVFQAFLEFILKKSKRSIYYIIAIISIIISQFISQFGVQLHFGFQNVFLAYFCYSIGMLLKNCNIVDNKFFMNNKLVNILLIVFTSFVLFFLSKNYSISFVDCKINNAFLFTLTSLSGFLLLFSLANIFKMFECIFIYLGKRTMPILLFHFLSFKIVTFILIKIKKLPIYLLASFPCLTIKYSWIIYTIVGVFIPIIIYELFLKFKKKVIKS